MFVRFPNYKNLFFAIICMFASALFFVFQFGNAYDQRSTHPALTVESAKFFNLATLENKLSQQEIDWIRQGAIEEDSVPRWINHFYDPVHVLAGLVNIMAD